ncbi:MAG: hypothetical protein V1802_00675 [Candidatus Aenigmatarchaeota archaeon]
MGVSGNKVLKQAKTTLRNIALTYVTLGTIYGWSDRTTGHCSADLHLGIKEPTKLERVLYNSFAEKY